MYSSNKTAEREKLNIMTLNFTFSLLLMTVCVMLPTATARADFGCMVSMFSSDEWKYDSVKATSICIQQVDRAASRCTSKSIKITPHVYYKWTSVPKTDVSLRHKVTGWCYRDSSNNCYTPTATMINSFTADLYRCLRRAFLKGFRHIYLIPMLDPYGNLNSQGAWRNSVEFNPLTAYGGLSFKQVVTDPTVIAAKKMLGAPNNTAQIHYGLAGEMNRPFVMYAKSWKSLTNSVKTGVAPYKVVAVGPTFAWNKLCGGYCELYSSNNGQISTTQWTEFRDFMQNVNTFGVSLYTNVWDRYNSNTKKLEFTYALRMLDQEMQRFAGVSLQTFQTKGAKLFLNELAVGGCSDTSCPVRNGDVRELSSTPWNGVGGPYHSWNDPWAQSWAKDFRMEYYRQALQWGYTNGSAPYRWHAAFSWSQGSWDIAGIYPDSTTAEGTWYDARLMNMIKAYNKAGTIPTNKFYKLP